MTFMIKNLIILSIFLIIAITVQLISGRKFLIIPHISLWIFVIISTLFVPEGKVLFKIGTISITQGALYTGLIKSLKLSTVSAISQAATTIQLQGNGILKPEISSEVRFGEPSFLLEINPDGDILTGGPNNNKRTFISR